MVTSSLELKTKLKHILERHSGRSSPITGLQLAKILNQRDDRRIRQFIMELIKEGLPIASATSQPAGYFIASTWVEKREYEATTKSRLIENAMRLRDFKRAPLRPVEQGRLC